MNEKLWHFRYHQMQILHSFKHVVSKKYQYLDIFDNPSDITTSLEANHRQYVTCASVTWKLQLNRTPLVSVVQLLKWTIFKKNFKEKISPSRVFFYGFKHVWSRCIPLNSGFQTDCNKNLKIILRCPKCSIHFTRHVNLVQIVIYRRSWWSK